MTTIVDYGAGNLRSVQNTLDEIGVGYVVTSNWREVKSAERIILPGVGHFGHMMASIDRLQLRTPLLDRLHEGIPFLGICVGLQCLFERSEEAPGVSGLGFFPGVVKRFSGEARIPHMGWNSLARLKEARLLDGLDHEPFVYFAHTYYAPLFDATVAACTYLQPYTALLEQENVCAVQFHPEKSGSVGLRVIRNFLEIPKCSLSELSRVLT